MSQLRSFITLLWIVSCSLAMPLDDSDEDDDCWLPIADSPSAALLAPYQTAHPSPSQHPHTSTTPAILGAVFGILIALACSLAACYVVRRRRGNPFKDPPNTGLIGRFRTKYGTPEKRLSDESWVSPELPALGSPGSPLSQDAELRQYAFPQRKLIPVTTPVTTPTDTEFEFEIPAVRVPAPAYISPFSPSPSMSSSPSSAPSIDPFPPPSAARLSRLLSCTFKGTSTTARPTTARLIQTARSYAHAYRPSSTTSTSLYAQPTSSVRLAGTRSRTSFYDPTWDRVRDTISTVTTSDTTCTVPHLLRAVGEDPRDEQSPGPRGTLLGLRVRLSDASEHARYRLRERERERRRQFERDLADSTRKEFRLRDSESVLREMGW